MPTLLSKLTGTVDRKGFTQPPFWAQSTPSWDSVYGDKERIASDFGGYVHQAYKANGLVFACMLTRLLVLSEARFAFRRIENGRPSQLFGSTDLSILERPWPGATTGELIARMEQDSSLAGNAFVTVVGKGDQRRLRRLRPDWVTIIAGSADDDPNALDARVIAYWYRPGGSAAKEEVLLPSEVAHYCVDEETEILTAEGWKDYQSLRPGDEALTLNHETGMSEWQAVSEVCVFPAQRREMVRMEGRDHSSLTTLNHRWPVERRHSKAGTYVRRWATSETLSSGDRLPIAAYCSDLPTTPKWSDALVEAVAWFWTEGCIQKNKGRPTRHVSISQSWKVNEANVARIRTALTTLFGPAVAQLSRRGPRIGSTPLWRERIDGNNVIFSLSRDAGDELTRHAPGCVVTTAFLRSLTAAQLELFVAVSMLAENAGPYRLAQKNPVMAEQFALACILSGRPVSLRLKKIDPRYGYSMTAVRMLRKRHVYPQACPERAGSRFRVERITHDGIVWCPRTPNQTWLARRKGSIYFTGNSPIPDPIAQWRGMSWLTPILREVDADTAATKHKAAFFRNGATTNFVVTYDKAISKESFERFVQLFKERQEGVDQAYKTMHLAGGADVKVVGSNLQQLDLKVTQGVGESRVAAASGIHPVIVGLSEGLAGSSLNAGNFASARRLTADRTLRPLWRMMAASLERLVPPPAGAQLWYDARDVAFLREDAKDDAGILQMEAAAIASLLSAGFAADVVVDAVVSGDLRRLSGAHSGLFSVQLQPPGASLPTAGGKGGGPPRELALVAAEVRHGEEVSRLQAEIARAKAGRRLVIERDELGLVASVVEGINGAG